MEIKAKGKLCFDVVVCGGGFAGVSAAVSAAREGVKVLLVEAGGELGGDITKSIVPQILDAAGKGGIVSELFSFLNEGHHTSVRLGERLDENGKNLPGAMVDLEYVKYYLDKICLDAGVTVIYHSSVIHAELQNSQITSILIAGEAGAYAAEGKVFVDATGNGALAGLCGCDFSFGHPESKHPQPCSTALLVTGIDESVSQTDTNADKDALKQKMTDCGISVSAEWIALVKLPQRNCWLLTFNNQYDVDPDDTLSISRATSEARIECIEVVDKMRGIHGFEGMEIVSTSSHIGVREGKRISGHYTLTYDDVTGGSRFDDAVCKARFPIDVHVISKDDTTDHKKGKSVTGYHIPYRSLLPRDCENLLLAGRCISGDFYAHASYRVAGNVIPMGEAAGYAAAACVKNGSLPFEIDGKEIRREMESRGYEI